MSNATPRTTAPATWAVSDSAGENVFTDLTKEAALARAQAEASLTGFTHWAGCPSTNEVVRFEPVSQ